MIEETFIERPRFSCALGGALTTINSLPGVISIVHAAIGCAGNLNGSIQFGSGYLGDGYCGSGHIPTSAVSENEIIFGGDEKLRKEIESTIELIDGELYIVLTGCMTDIIGDDVQAIANSFKNEGQPVIAVNTVSFKGHSYWGYELLIDKLFNDYLPKSPKKNPKLVNLFGLVPGYDPFFRGDLNELARIIRALGLEVNTFFTPDQTFDNIKSAPQAALNILLSPVWGKDFVKTFESVHDVPYWIADLPVGAAASDLFIKELGRRLDVDKKAVNSVIKQENHEYYGFFARAADIYRDSDYKYYAATATNSTYAIPYSYFLQEELGWIAADTYVTDVLHSDQRADVEKAHLNSGLNGKLIFETDTSHIARSITQNHPRNRGQLYFDSHTPFYVLGSTLEKLTAASRQSAHLSVSYPLFDRIILDRGYAGYRGGLHLFEDLIDVLVSPKA